MLEILEWSVTFQDISLQTKLAHRFVNVSLLWNPFRGVQVNRKGKKPTLDWLQIWACYQLWKHSMSVNIAHINALLSYGKKGRDVDTFDESRYTMVMTTDKSATMLPQPKMPSKSMSFMPNVILWFRAKATSQSKSWLNQLVIAGQLATMNSSLRQCTICSRWGSRLDSSILYI